jgi:anti-anti-sigma factor
MNDSTRSETNPCPTPTDQPVPPAAVYILMAQQPQPGWSPRVRHVRPVRGRDRPSAGGRHGTIFSHAELTIQCVREDDRELVAVGGRLDLWSAWEFERELRRVEASDVHAIIIDLAGLHFIDAAGIDVVNNVAARSRHHSKQLMIRGGDEAAQRTVQRGGPQSRGPLVDSERSARLS